MIRGRPGGASFPLHTRLSDREVAVVRSLLQGRSQVQMAADLGLTVPMVRSSVRRIYNGTGIRNMHSLALWALQHRPCCVAPAHARRRGDTDAGP